jgi:Tol biopolymer transport system component
MRERLSILPALGLVVMLGSSASAAGQHAIVRVSVSGTGEQANGDSGGTSISGSGRWVAFASAASNLVPNDTNGDSDIFVRDPTTNTTKLVSTNSSGNEGNLPSSTPVISADGRWVAFSSYANNLTRGDVNGEPDIFVHDLSTGETKVVSVSSSGELGNNRSLFPSISGDGSRIAFQSDASNLVSGDSNDESDVFVHDLATGRTELVSQSSFGIQADTLHDRGSSDATISANGRAVAFVSPAHNLTPNDVNHSSDVFVRDLLTNKTVLASVSSSGGQGAGGFVGAPSLSPGGRRVVFESNDEGLVDGDTTGLSAEDIFLHDLRDGTTQLVSVSSSGEQANNFSDQPSIRRDLVLFQSAASNLVANDTNAGRNIFVHDLSSGETKAIDVGSSGELASFSFDPSMSADGSHVAFTSYDDDLVPVDTNGYYDIFVSQPSS